MFICPKMIGAWSDGGSWSAERDEKYRWSAERWGCLERWSGILNRLERGALTNKGPERRSADTPGWAP